MKFTLEVEDRCDVPVWPKQDYRARVEDGARQGGLPIFQYKTANVGLICYDGICGLDQDSLGHKTVPEWVLKLAQIIACGIAALN